MPRGRHKRLHISEYPVEFCDARRYGLREPGQFALIIRRRNSAKLRIPQLDRLDVPGSRLGIDDQHPPTWVALTLSRQEPCGQLPLARPTRRIDLRVERQQHLRSRQPSRDRARDLLKIRNLV